MVWTAIVVALPMTILSDRIILMLYGEAFKGAGNVLMVHIWTGVFVFLGVASGKWLITENYQSIAFYRTFYGVIANIILNYILIKRMGVIGAAIATLAANMIAAFLFDIFNKKTRLTFFMKAKTLILGGVLDGKTL
jgi:O-antigen/teichoic acid export membrane protein